MNNDRQQQLLVEFDKAKKDITITCERAGTFSTAPFQNAKGKTNYSVSLKEVNWSLDDIDLMRDTIGQRLDADLALQQERAYQAWLEDRFAEIRWYDNPDKTEKWPSVTSVMNLANPPEWHVTEERLKYLAARGNVGDAVLQEYIESGEWRQPEQIASAYANVQMMKKGKVQLEGDMAGFVQKFGVKFLAGHKKVLHLEHKYGGELDCIARFEGCDYIDPEWTCLVDLKMYNPQGDTRVRVFKQMAAYAKAGNGFKIDALVVMPIHGETKQGYSKPTVVSGGEIDECFELFLADRRTFYDMFKR